MALKLGPKSASSGLITGLTFDKNRTEKCTWASVIGSSTVSLILEELEFDCSNGQLNVTFFFEGVSVDLCGIPGKKGVVGSGGSFMMVALLPLTSQNAVTRLRLRYYSELFLRWTPHIIKVNYF